MSAETAYSRAALKRNLKRLRLTSSMRSSSLRVAERPLPPQATLQDPLMNAYPRQPSKRP